MSLRAKTIGLISFFTLFVNIANAQNDAVLNKEITEYSTQVSKNFWPPQEELDKIRSEMYFVLFQVRDSIVRIIEVYASKDTVLKKHLESYLSSQIGVKKFKSAKNHDFVLPIVIKNVAIKPGLPIYNSDYDYLLWKDGKPKKFNRLDNITTLPIFIIRNSKPFSRKESLAPKSP